MHMKLILIGLSLAIAIPAFPQAKPAAELQNPQLLVGAGFTDFANGMTNDRNESYAVWADWKPNIGPSVLKNLGVEAEFRTYKYDQVGSHQLNQTTYGGGPIYTLQRWSNIHPYGKFLINYAQMDYVNVWVRPVTYPQPSWVTYSPGGGVEYRVWGNLWVREDYEYQFWRINIKPGDNHYLNPNGFTIGASYDFGRHRFGR
jgi:opacity protein-like surface antigen